MGLNPMKKRVPARADGRRARHLADISALERDFGFIRSRYWGRAAEIRPWMCKLMVAAHPRNFILIFL